MSLIRIKLNHLTQHFLIASVKGHHQSASTNPLNEKSQRRTPFSRKKGNEEKEFYDSWFALFLDVIFAVKPQPYILLCPSDDECMCDYSEFYIIHFIYDFYYQKFTESSNFILFKPRRKIFSSRSSRDKKQNLYKRRESWPRIIVEAKLQTSKIVEIQTPPAMRRALTFLLIFTYQIMSVVFYLIFPRSTFYRIS